MRVTERLATIDQIGRELQRRYSYSEIDAFLRAFGVEPLDDWSGNSKWLYAKDTLAGTPNKLLLEIAAELELPASKSTGIVPPPRAWEDTKLFRLFISHVSKDKDKANRLKECLAPYGISGFVAHEDIHPTLEWQIEIERALRSMDAFIAVLTEGFSKSIWTQQEIGFAVGRGVKIISFKMGEDPTGFISKHQALPRRNRTAEAVAQEIDQLLMSDDHTAERLTDAKTVYNQMNGIQLDDDIPF